MRLRLWIAALLLPGALILLLFVAVPMLGAFAGAFRAYDGVRPAGWAGFANLRDVLFVAPFAGVTWRAAWHNLLVFAALMVVQNGVAFFVAYGLLRALPGHRVHRVIVFLPVVLSAVVVGFLWKLLLHPLFGVINTGLRAVGLGGLALSWLGEPGTALPSLVLANVWHFMGFPALVFLAGMQRVPAEVLEAARLDGARDWALLRRVVWPLIAPSVTIVTVLTFIGSANWFELPYVMEGVNGSPGGATDVLGLVFYRTAFGGATNGITDFGRGSALAVVMFVFVGAVSAALLRFLRGREVEA